jgi:hypothetical protein
MMDSWQSLLSASCTHPRVESCDPFYSVSILLIYPHQMPAVFQTFYYDAPEKPLSVIPVPKVLV